MVSEHAMLILMLLLAVAVVILAIGLSVYAGKVDAQLKRLSQCLDEGALGQPAHSE